ncbi:hypothetical protein Q5P01_012923 [Channa striata]|uniref:Uncharacterized protein n=1 Tax=Channa striata TaxID=64152 RepID=A0AA88SNJ1_CHASR|nr:hypothetical protein Q5P01_012923 [Channa striata]
MFHRDLALEALGSLLNSEVTSVQKRSSQVHHSGVAFSAAAAHEQLSIKQFIPTVLVAEESSEVSNSCFLHIQNVLQGHCQAAGFAAAVQDTPTGKIFVIDENEFFASQYDYDFTNLRDTETYRRGGEVYERPCGWFRFGLKVLDKYDGNTWLGTSYRSTQSVPGEWPVSYHGTSKQGAEGIIGGHYKPGSGQVYGRGIYSTPFMVDAIQYAKSFTSNTTGKRYKVILQNRINPQYREKHLQDRYWLIPIPAGTSPSQEQVMVDRSIRPYGLLLKEL